MAQKWLIGALLLTLAGVGEAQKVEYVTRNVQPTHAVRFTSTPIRITLTDRGFVKPLANAPVVRHRKLCRCSRCGGRVISGGGVIIIRDHGEHEAEAKPRPRTVYGRDRGKKRDHEAAAERDGSREPSAEGEPEAPERAADRRHLLRVLSMIQARKERAEPKTAGAGADDR